MDIQKILDYQTKDLEIAKLERLVSENQDKKKMETILASVKESKNTSAYLEKEAEEASLQFANLKKSYENAMNLLSSADAKSKSAKDEIEGEGYIGAFNQIAQNLSNLESNLRTLAEKISNILSDYNTAKNNYAKAKQNYSAYKTRYDSLLAEIEPKIKELNTELKTLEKGVDKTMLAKYKARRPDKVFPIVVPMLDNTCGGCMMGLPSGQIDKLKRDGYLECENCHRILYNNK